MSDLDAVAYVESVCFPPERACSKERFAGRLQYYPNHFHLLFLDEKLISFTDGFVTDEKNLRDEMYEDPSLHDENGRWQMIFGVNTLPEYRNHGYAGILIKDMIRQAKEEQKAGLVLTCLEEKIHWYASFGFVNEGISSSEHGGVTWYQMRLSF